MWQKESQFFIENKNKEKALQAIKYALPVYTQAKTLNELLASFDWGCITLLEGSIVEIIFFGEEKSKEYEIFKLIAPFVKEGSFIHMKDKHSEWQWQFRNHTCIEKEASISFN